MITVAPLNDFPDRLSPMVVKELRQGLRTRLFGGVMLALHGLFVLITLLSGVGSDGVQARGLMDGLITFVLCGIFPLCAFSALAGEMKANTMDMLVLTRLSAGRIVLGKWAAIVFQSLLVTISLVPYLVARYVFGGSELLSDIYILFFQWLISAVLTAGVVALSTQKQFWLRALIIVVPFFLAGLTSMVRLGMGVMRGGPMTASAYPNAWGALGWFLGGAWLIFALLSFGATRIAPAASLLSVPKRLVNLAALLLLPPLEWMTNSGSNISASIIVILIVASVDALTEEVRSLPSVYLPFYQRSWWGRLSGLFLAPGWMHGFLYTLVMVAIGSVAVWLVQDEMDAARIWLVGCCLWISALFAQALSFNRRGEYLGVTIAGAFLLYVLTMLSLLLTVASSRSSEMKWLICVLPSTAMMPGGVPADQMPLFYIGVIVNALWPLLLALFAMRAFVQNRLARKEARQLSQS